MTLTARLQDGSVILARDANRGDAPFFCSFCDGPMVLRKGIVKIEHFAHQKLSDCPYSTGETYEHEKAKFDLMMRGISSGIKSEVEVKLSPRVRADVLLTLGNQKVAVEFQKSGMTKEQCIQRLNNYYEAGIPVIWVFLNEKLKGDDYLNRSADTRTVFFYRLNFSKVYFLNEGDMIDVWRCVRIPRYSMIRRWERIGSLSLLDTSKFYLQHREKYEDLPECFLWAPKSSMLKGRNILLAKNMEVLAIIGDGGMTVQMQSASFRGIMSIFGDVITWDRVETVYYYEGWQQNMKEFFIPSLLLRSEKHEVTTCGGQKVVTW